MKKTINIHDFRIDRDYYEAALTRIKREIAQMTLIDTPNAEAQRPAVAGTLPPLVGHSGASK